MIRRPGSLESFQALDAFGLIGDMRTAALVGESGSIEWFCFPRFDSPSVFGAILDCAKGGVFRVTATGTEVIAKQYYWHDSNVLVTNFITATGSAELRDYMPVSDGRSTSRLIRRQLDVFGELMEAVFVLHKAGVTVSVDLWQHLRGMINWLVEHWREPDEGIWEVRGGRKQFTFSRLMSWIALDRGIHLAEHLGFPAEIERWTQVRGEIVEAIVAEGWSENRRSFVQYPGAHALDTSLLLIPILGFLGHEDPRVIQTLDLTMKSRDHGGLACNGRVYRYDTARTDDGLPGDEGPFNICTFWLVEALALAADARPEWINDAQDIFERMLLTANHLGLFPEQSGVQGEPLGNFPQGFTHLGLISAALALDKTLDAMPVVNR